MFMNSDLNNDSKQCTESKPGRVHSAHTHGPGCACTAPRLGALSWRIERRIVAPGRVVAGLLLQYRRPLVTIQNYIVKLRPMLRALRVVSRARPAVSQVVSQHATVVSQRCIAALLHHIATQMVATSHDTIFVSRLTPGQVMRARTPLAPARRSTVSQRCIVRVVGRITALLHAPSRTRSTVSWPCVPVVSRYNILYRDQGWEMGSSPPSCQKPFFFFFHSFFFLPFVPATVRPPIYIYIYIFMSSVKPNKFIRIYLFLFFFQFYTL